MFFAAEMKLIREICLNEYESLLNLLGIPKPNWIGDEYRIYEQLDAQLTNRICSLMKSESIIDGYIKLLKLGGISFDYSEVDLELLRKILANQTQILNGLEHSKETIIEEVVEDQISSQPISTSQPKMKEIKHREHVTLPKPIILGAILIILGLLSAIVLTSKIIGLVISILGMISAFLGIRGKTKITTEWIQIPNDEVQTQPVTKKTTRIRRENRVEFEPDDLKKIFEILSKIDVIKKLIGANS